MLLNTRLPLETLVAIMFRQDYITTASNVRNPALWPRLGQRREALGNHRHTDPVGEAAACRFICRHIAMLMAPEVEMPEELREPLSDAVMEFLVDEGMAKRK